MDLNKLETDKATNFSALHRYWGNDEVNQHPDLFFDHKILNN